MKRLNNETKRAFNHCETKEVRMDFITNIGTLIGPYVAVLWAIDQLLKVIAPLTPWKVDDNISDMLGKLLSKFFPKK